MCMYTQPYFTCNFTDNCSTSSYLISDGLNGPAFAVVVGIEMILALLTNLTIFIFTLYQWKSLKQPSTIFLSGLLLANLIMTIFFMPFTFTVYPKMKYINK